MLVGCGINHLILHGGRRLVGLLVHPKIVDLKPETDLLLLSKRCWLAIGGLYLGPDLVGANHKITGTDLAGGDGLHLIGKNQRGGSKLLIAKIGHGIATAENAGLVAVYVLHHYVKPV